MPNKKLKVGNVPNLRFPGFTEEWEVTKLGELSELITKGTTPKKFISKGIKFIKIECFDGDKINMQKCLFIDEYVHKKELKRSILKENDLLFAIAGATIGKVNIVTEEILPANTNQALAIIRLKKNENSKFIYQILKSNIIQKYIKDNISVGAQPNLNLEQMNSFSFYNPLFSEQEKIATFLSLIDDRIQAQNKIIEQLKTLILCFRNQIFSQKIRFKNENGTDFSEWNEVKIGEILKIGSGKDYKHLQPGNIPVFGTGGVMTLVDDYIYDGETVCVGRKGTIDKPMYHNGKIWTVDTLFYTHSFQSCIPKFIFHLFRTINWLEYNEASGVPSLSKTTIEKIKVQIPSLEEQHVISIFLSAIDKKIQIEKTILEQLEKQKKYLLKEMFI
jgi:type I restriction enzyme S subunit